uniref:Uncharacterized protein n=1 Tax=Lotharella globosa TaxID=91324 RepID=A0A7S3YSX1_9EUKA
MDEGKIPRPPQAEAKRPVAAVVMDVAMPILEVARSNVLERIGAELGASDMRLRKIEEVAPCLPNRTESLELQFHFKVALDDASGCACREFVERQVANLLPQARWKVVSLSSVSSGGTRVSAIVRVPGPSFKSDLWRLASIRHPKYGDVAVREGKTRLAKKASRICVCYEFKSRAAAERTVRALRPRRVFALHVNNKRVLSRVVNIVVLLQPPSSSSSSQQPKAKRPSTTACFETT